MFSVIWIMKKIVTKNTGFYLQTYLVQVLQI